MAGLRQPDIQSLQKYGIDINKVKDVSYNALYDYQDYAMAGVSTMTFFQVPIGQSSKTLADTNMKLAGQLPKGEEFLVTGIEVAFFPSSNDISTDDATLQYAYDYYRVMRAPSWLQFNILNKDYVQQGPLCKFPPAQHFELNSAMAEGNAALHSSSILQHVGQTYEIVPVALQSSMSFDVTVNFKTVIPVNSDGRIGVSLRGFRYRNAQ